MNETVPPESFSQFGEDWLIWQFFGESPEGFFVDVGANDPEKLSQSLLLERQGWRGVLVEPMAACCERLRRHRPLAQVFQVACGAPEQRGTALLQLEGLDGTLSKLAPPAAGQAVAPGFEQVQVVTLDDILEQVKPARLDFLSIDVEGVELQVLQGLNLQKYRPRLLMVEDNLPNRLAVHRHIRRQGYRLVKRTGCNNWYVPAGEPFPYSTFWERLKLYRKMYPGTLWRQFRRHLTGH